MTKERNTWQLSQIGNHAPPTHCARCRASTESYSTRDMHIFPAGRAYLTRLEIFLGNFHDTPFQPRTPQRNTRRPPPLDCFPPQYHAPYQAQSSHTTTMHSQMQVRNGPWHRCGRTLACMWTHWQLEI